MRTLSLVWLAINYPFSRPRTLLKLGLMLLWLGASALALFGLLMSVGLIWLFTTQWDDSHSGEYREVTVPFFFGYYIPPQWTPDGNTIYLRYAGVREVPTYVVSSDGSELKELKYVVRPHVSPDGSRIVYSTRDTDKYSYDIETAKPDESDRRRLTEDPKSTDIAAVWSPDGSRVAFARLALSSLTNPGYGVYVMAADGSGLRRIYRLRGSLPEDTADEEFHSGPVWSPDGETLAFAIRRRSAVGIGKEREVLEEEFLYTMGADGSNLTAVYDTETPPGIWASTPVWSPDGSQLAFGHGTPYIVNSDGTGLRKAANVSSVSSVSWSPDGTRLLLIGASLKQKSTGAYSVLRGVHVAEADGGSYEYLGDGYREVHGASWSPDGSRIAIYEKADQDAPFPQSYLQTMAPDGSDVQVLLEKHEDGELRAANPADGWKWPWQR